MAGSREKTKTGGKKATTGHIQGDYALSVGMPSTPAPDGWKWTKLTDVARLETGHTPARKHPEYWDGDIPWIGIRDATANHGRTIPDTNQHTNELGINNSSARVLPTNTVCLSRTASVGYVVVMGRPMATSQDFVNWVCDDDLLDYRFLKYVLLSENRSFLRFASGTTHQTIYFPEVKAFHICLPRIEEQRAIASILGALDDKIELNRRMNATLESLARAIFKSWFVDFDPVRSKSGQQAEPPSGTGAATATSPPPRDLSPDSSPAYSPFTLPPSTSALFPSTFQDSDLGKIPTGWEVGRLDDLLVLQRGFDLPKKNRENGQYPVYAAGGHHGLHNEFKVKGPGIVTGRSGVIGNVYYVHEDHWPLNTTLWVKEFKGSRPIHAFHHLQDVGLKTFNAGSAVPSLNRNHVHGLPTLIPPIEIVEEYERRIQPLFDRQRHNERESLTLSTLRDTLLPKLLSGELPVPAALTATSEALASVQG